MIRERKRFVFIRTASQWAVSMNIEPINRLEREGENERKKCEPSSLNTNHQINNYNHLQTNCSAYSHRKLVYILFCFQKTGEN